MSKLPETQSRAVGTWIAYLLPVILVVALPLIYVISPPFYLAYIIEGHKREYQFVELSTEVFALFGCVLMLIGGVRAWRSGTADRVSGRVKYKPGTAGLLDGRGGAAVILLLAMGTFFFAGEEISWGQTYFGWESELRETNLHNTVPISFSGLGSIVIMVLLVGLPVVWRLRDRLPVPRDWEPAIAEGPVVLTVVLGFLVSFVKDIAQMTIEDKLNSRVYMEYFEQLNEQKELFIALAMLMYGWYRVRKIAGGVR